MELAAKKYADENDRLKLLDSKSGALAAAAGGAVLFIAGSLLKTIDPSQPHVVMSMVSKIAVLLALACFLAADIVLVVALKIRTYRRFDLPKWVGLEYMEQSPKQFYAGLAST